MRFNSCMNKYPISKQILVTLLVTLSIILILLCSIAVFFQKQTEKNTEALIDNNFSHLRQTMSANYENMVNIVNYVSFQSDLNNFLLSDNPEEKYRYYTAMNSTIKGAMGLNENILDIFVVQNSNNRIYANSTPIATRISKPMDTESDGLCYLDDENIFILTAPVSNPVDGIESLKTNGYIVFLLNPSFLIYSPDKNSINYDTFITDVNGHIIWQSNSDHIYTKQMDMAETVVQELGLTLHMAYPDPWANFFNSFHNIVAVILILLTIAVISVLWTLEIQNIITPIKKFTGLIREYSPSTHGDLEKDMPTAYPEINTLGKEFVKLIRKSEELTDELIKANSEIYEQKLLRTQAELEYLRSQINPHFLYNTLDSLSGVAAENGQVEILQMTKSLSNIFKYSLRAKPLVSLSDELKVVNNYLFIQKLRFGEKLNIIRDIHEDTLQRVIPKMILQPIVENAVIHGVEESENNCQLSITTETDQRHELVITIKNSGKQIDRKELEEIRRMLCGESQLTSSDGRVKIGLYNVNARLKLNYGNDHGLEITSSEKETCILIRIPEKTEGAI